MRTIGVLDYKLRVAPVRWKRITEPGFESQKCANPHSTRDSRFTSRGKSDRLAGAKYFDLVIPEVHRQTAAAWRISARERRALKRAWSGFTDVGEFG